jgi:hypothetical protein
MNRILEIQRRSNDWLANFGVNVVRIIESNAEKVIDFNRDQMLDSKDADNKPLIHVKTGSELLSKPYAKRTGKAKPNLWLNGDFQSAMFMTMPDEKEYFISSKDFKSGYLSKNYGKIFGVAPENQPKAQAINDKAIIDDYMKSVFI